MAETAINFIGGELIDVAKTTANKTVSVVKAPVEFVKKLKDGKLNIAGFKASQLGKDLAGLTKVTTMPNSVAGGVNALVGKAKDLRATMSKHTGLDVDFGIETLGTQFNEMIAPFTPYASKGQLNEKFKNYVKSLKAQIQASIDDCISKHLRALRNKIPVLDIALDPELFIAKELGKIRQKLQVKIDLAKSKLLYAEKKFHNVELIMSKYQNEVYDHFEYIENKLEKS